MTLKYQSLPCPADEVLAAFIEHRLHGPECERVEEHVAGCAACLDVVAATVPAAVHLSRSTVAVASRARLKPSRSPRWRRWVVAAGLVLVGGSLLLSTVQSSLVPRLGSSGAWLANHWFGKAFHAESVSLRLGRTPGTIAVTLGTVRIGRDAHMFLSADTIRTTVALAAPIFGDPMLSDVQLVGLNVEVAEPPSVTLVWPKAERVRALEILREADRVGVQDARLVVHGGGGRTFAVEHLNGGVERSGGGVKFALQGRTGGGGIDVVGSVVDAEDGMTVTLAGRDLDAAMLPILDRQVTGVADLRLDLTSRGDAVLAKGRIAIRKGRLVGRGPTRILPLDRETVAALTVLDANLTQGDLAFDEARAVFAWRHGTWRLPRVFLSAGPTIVGGRFHVDGGDVSGHGAIQLPANLFEGMEPHLPALASFRDTTGGGTLPFGVSGSIEKPHFALGRP
jgi:Putative zinc-finger